MSTRDLQVSKQFMVKELTSYQDELFCQLFHDMSGFSQNLADQVFDQQDRRISIYGIRGLGKTTAMQGALWYGLRKKSTNKYIPINVVVLGARGVTDPLKLSDLFYKSVILGINRVAAASDFKKELTQAAARYAPWVAKKITEAAGVIIGPIALASDLSEKGVRWLVKHLGYSNIDTLISSKDLDSQQAAMLLIDKLEEEGGKLVFMIDELDKVENDTVLSDFFDGNQAWFQGKQGMISLSYTFGKSLSKTLVTSASRISLIESFPGITSAEDAAEIIRSRMELGLSQIKDSKETAEAAAAKIMPNETVRAILNVSAPNSHIMLERTSQAIDAAISSKAEFVSSEHVYVEPEEQTLPTTLEASILRELTACKLSPSVISDRLHKDRGLTSRTLQKLMAKNWVDRHGEGKRAYYFITPKGEAANRRIKDS